MSLVLCYHLINILTLSVYGFLIYYFIVNKIPNLKLRHLNLKSKILLIESVMPSYYIYTKNINSYTLTKN